MRLIDADAFKQYCSEGLEEMKSLFKTDKGAELAVKVTESFLKDIDEQPTVEAQPMRDATEEERKSVKDYVESISKPTGVHFDEAQPTDAVRLISLDDIMAHFPKANFNGDPIENKKAYPYWKTDITGLISILKSVPMVKPCGNAVSRSEVIKTIKEMSNANPSYTHTCDVVDRQDLIDSIDELPSVTPERPKGKWIRIAGFEDCNYDKCSVCGVYQVFYYGKPSTNFCPNCGAEMSGGEEDG